MIKKAVIPAAGFGTRMLPLTKAQPKEMLPVVHKPVIQYVVEEAYQSGIREILIITGKHKRPLEDHFDRSEIPVRNEYLDELDELLENVDIFFVRQREQKGLGNAVSYAEAFIGGEDFALLLGDIITSPNCTEKLLKIYKKYKSTIIAVEEVEKSKVSSYGVISVKKSINDNDIFLIEDLIEKPSPEEAPSNLAIIGRYILTPEIFDCIRETPPGRGGEIQLTDALRILNRRESIYAYLFRGKRYDIGNKVDWIIANIELGVLDREVGDKLRSLLKKFK